MSVGVSVSVSHCQLVCQLGLVPVSQFTVKSFSEQLLTNPTFYTRTQPDFIVREAIKTHVGMIKEARGIPGVLEDRWKAAHTVRHCALSLVGEPIMYPRINELLMGLHRKRISTYLVTNGQHPDAIESLVPVTQLYVSVDAPTPASLEAIDRPLFKDAWERLKRSLALVRKKGQRTVARLTIVKGWNSDEIEGYANLVALGQVSFVELKGVTFCGTSDASNLNMSNSPFHHEVLEFTEKLRLKLKELTFREGNPDPPPLYGIACEHKHSCSVLLARYDQFCADYNGEDEVVGEVYDEDFLNREKVVRKWRTWIDYDKFTELSDKFAADNTFSFGTLDYLEDTPDWATFGNNAEGFDPTDARFFKKGKVPKYQKFDDAGIPTHDYKGVKLTPSVRKGLEEEMAAYVAKHAGGEIIQGKGGERKVKDPKLLFRGISVVDKEIKEKNDKVNNVMSEEEKMKAARSWE